MTKEEAIRRIKSWNLDSDDMEVLSVVIPELRESEDEMIRKFIQNELVCLRALEDKGSERYNELTSAVTYIGKQKPAEWSEEDKEMVRRALFYTEQYRTNYGDTKESEECFNWLLDLHRNIRPPFHWKPSKEQMDTLRDVVINLQNIPWAYNPLKELYEQLNKQ